MGYISYIDDLQGLAQQEIFQIFFPNYFYMMNILVAE